MIEYHDEKADALQRLANLIDSILNPRANVLPMITQAQQALKQEKYFLLLE